VRTISKFGLALWVIGSMGATMAVGFRVWAQQPAETPPEQTMPMQGAQEQHGMPGMRPMAGSAAGTADPAMMQSMQKMHQDMMSTPLTGDADRDFVAMMIPHHQGAIDMAQTELQYGKDPMLRQMASEIITAQEKEIHEMQQWQKHPGNR
jgi:uncharacterized protein (DUF305 family)